MTTKEISDYIFLEDKRLRADIALVFGTSRAWEESIEKATELYKRKLIPKIIVSGGKNRRSGIVEGDVMAEGLKKLGVQEKDILIENKATNTLENVLFSLEIIDKEIGLENIGIVCAVVKNFHARRALMTLHKHFPNHIQLKSAVYTSSYYPFSKENWYESDLGKEVVMREVEKIQKYLKKGDLAEL